MRPLGTKIVVSVGALLLLAVAAPAAAQSKPRPQVRAAISAAGPGIVVDDWRIGVTVPTGTDSSGDTINDKEHAREREYSAAEARRQGQVQANPMAKFIPGAKPPPPKPLGPGFDVAKGLQDQLAPSPARRPDGLGRTPPAARPGRDKRSRRAVAQQHEEVRPVRGAPLAGAAPPGLGGAKLPHRDGSAPPRPKTPTPAGR